MDIYCQVTSQGLIPMYDSDLSERKRLKEGDKVLVTIKRPRNYEFHKKFFALLRLTVDNMPSLLASQLTIKNEDDLLECLKMDFDMFTVRWHAGRQILHLDSISFASMDETEFNKFYNRCVDRIIEVYLRGTNKQQLLDEIEKYK